jgi:acetyl esterase
VTLDPAVFRPEAIDPETAAFNVQLEQLFAGQPPMQSQDPKQIRAARAAGQGPSGPVVRSPKAKDSSIPGPACPIPLRIFRPDRVEGVYLHFHGGGWVLGANDLQDPKLEAIAEGCNLAVVSVGYRLAPEDPYPSGPDDCEATALWLLAHAAAEFGTERLLIGGESAGAHLAVVTLVRLRERHGLKPFAAANLAYGVYDVDGTPSVATWGERRLVLNTPIMQWFADHYVPVERRREPDVSPIYADLSGLPKALFSVGTLDPLLDDTLFMYTRWLSAGSEAELAIYPGGVHGFNSFPTSLAKRCTEREYAFLRAAAASSDPDAALSRTTGPSVTS